MIKNHEVDPYLEVVKRSTDLDLEIIKEEVDQVPSIEDFWKIDQEVIQGIEQRGIGLDLRIKNLEKDHILVVVIQVVDQFPWIVYPIQETEDQEVYPGQKQEGHVVDH